MPFESIELNLRRNRIPYFSLRDKQQEKRKIKNKLKQFNKLLNSMHLNFRKIEIDPFDGADDFELKINRNEFGSYIIDPKAKITYVCDKYIKNLKRYILNKRISYI